MGAVNLRGLQVKGNWFNSGGMEQYVSEQYKNASGQVFKAGELLTLNATPELIRFASIVGTGDDRLDVSLLNPAPLTLAATLLKIYGIALKDAPASGQVIIPVAVFMPGTLVEGNLVTGGAGGDGDVLGTPLALTAAHLSAPVALLFDDTNDRWYFTSQIVTTAERCADIVKIGMGVGGGGTQDPYGAIGDTTARVQCTIRSTVMRSVPVDTVAGTT